MSTITFPDWQFSPLSVNGIQRDPTLAEFFKSDVTMSASLLREVLQNSLDASLGTGPVRVRIAVVHHNAQHIGTLNRYYGGLGPHLTASGVAPTGGETLLRERSLVVEDFGTIGLTGDPASTSAHDGGHYYYFVRAEGRSGKSGGQGGRWGLGKHVYAMASGINAYWALTTREDRGDKTDLLVGRCVLKHHDITGTTYEPDGWWSLQDEAGVNVPLMSSSHLDAFRRDWAVQRESGQTGLSVVVPQIGPAPDGEDPWSVEVLTKLVLEHFGVAILQRRLEVELHQAEGPKTVAETRLTEASVLDLLMKESDGIDAGVRSRLRMVAEGLTGAAIPLPSFSNDWTRAKAEELGEGTLASLTEASKSLESGQVVRFRIPLTVQPKGGTETGSSVDLILRKRDVGSGSGSVSYHRQGMWILGEKGQSLGFFDAVVLAEDQPISQLLGDAENPAHTRWSKSSGEFTDKWTAGDKRIRYVRQAPQKVHALVFRIDEQGDFTVAEEFFTIPVGGPGNQKGRTGRSGAGGTGTPTPPKERPSSGVSIQDATSGVGFRVRAGGVRADSVLTIECGYAISRGNGIKKWSSADFDLATGTPTVTLVGGAVVEAVGNRIKASVENPETFQLECVGFDANRDLLVDAAVEEVEAA